MIRVLKLNELYNETARHLALINLKESVQNNVDSTNLLNVALENVVFMFRKTKWWLSEVK